MRVRFPSFQHFACEGGRKFAEEEPPRFMRASSRPAGRKPSTSNPEGRKQTGGPSERLSCMTVFYRFIQELLHHANAAVQFSRLSFAMAQANENGSEGS